MSVYPNIGDLLGSLKVTMLPEEKLGELSNTLFFIKLLSMSSTAL
jgi:hypothetical protein